MSLELHSTAKGENKGAAIQGLQPFSKMLIFLGFYLVASFILSLVVFVESLLRLVPALHSFLNDSAHNNFKPLVTAISIKAVVVGTISQIGVGILIVLYFQKKPIFLVIAKAFFAFLVVNSFFDIGVSLFLYGGVPNARAAFSIVRYLPTIVFSSCWLAYLIRSKEAARVFHVPKR